MDTIKQKILTLLQQVNDPEIPVLSIMDLGILRDVVLNKNHVEVIITPTYSGCPAMNQVEWDIRTALLTNNYPDHSITTVLSPAWTTDWMTEAGKQKLKAYGIAPPNATQSVCHTTLFAEEEAVQCPHCNAQLTTLISRFGSTACKALYRCNECQETFDYFKCH